MITYESQRGRMEGEKRRWDIDVLLDGKRVGVIKRLNGGWGYIPKGERKPERKFPTLNEVKRHLEADE